jgi:dihydrodipicolinate synthase/N-acetylneuraminate lyase
MKPQWTGIYPALTTKFTDDFKVDIASCIKNVEAQINSGIHGCVIAGSLGEASTLTQDEKIFLLKEISKHVNGRIPVLMNIAEQSTAEAVKAAQNSQESGADGLMM